MSQERVDALKGQIVEYLKNPVRGQTFGHLMAEFGLQKGRYLDSGLPESRALDRALQALRKAGKVRFERREWHLSV